MPFPCRRPGAHKPAHTGRNHQAMFRDVQRERLRAGGPLRRRIGSSVFLARTKMALLDSKYSAICADCNQLITDRSLQSVIVLPAANREMNHRSSRQTWQRRPAIPRPALSGVRVPGHGACRVARPAPLAWHGPASPAWHGSWHGAPGNPSTASAVCAITRVIGAARHVRCMGPYLW